MSLKGINPNKEVQKIRVSMPFSVSNPRLNNIGSASKALLSKIPSWETTKSLGRSFGKGGLVGAAIGTPILFGIVSAISSKADSLRRPPVIHTSRIRSTGQTNQYYNLGVDPFAGVRFAGRKRNFMV
jgi:hypothetical protein